MLPDVEKEKNYTTVKYELLSCYFNTYLW